MDDRGTRAGNKVRAMVSETESAMADMIAYFNDEVVPEIRRGSSVGLRAAAEQLGRLAEHLDRGPRKPPAPASSQPCAGR